VDISEVESSYMSASVRVKKWREQFLEQWNKPKERSRAIALTQMNPDALLTAAPEDVNDLLKLIAGEE
jgi:hypothetical protein